MTEEDIIKKKKKFKLKLNDLNDISKNYKTPFHLYFEDKIINRCKKLNTSYINNDIKYKNYFAVKSNSNLNLIKIIINEGNQGLDCSSLTELLIAEKLGLKGDNIMFTSNNTSVEEFQKSYDLNCIITFDNISHIDYFEESNKIKNEIIWKKDQCFSLR
jgi:diaminopimelate decarboxylase